jgi:hypothetical protein
MTPESCPNCGADVPANAQACPECGSCEETGWSETAYADGLGLPDESFNYEKFVEREFSKNPRQPRRKGALWIWLGAGLLIASAVLALLWR